MSEHVYIYTCTSSHFVSSRFYVVSFSRRDLAFSRCDFAFSRRDFVFSRHDVPFPDAISRFPTRFPVLSMRFRYFPTRFSVFPARFRELPTQLPVFSTRFLAFPLLSRRNLRFLSFSSSRFPFFCFCSIMISRLSRFSFAIY